VKKQALALAGPLRHMYVPWNLWTLDSYFDKIFVINVEGHSQRWQRMVDSLAKAGVSNYERFNAVTPATAVKYGWKWPSTHRMRTGVN
jgi:hypothetical protein